MDAPKGAVVNFADDFSGFPNSPAPPQGFEARFFFDKF